MLEPRPRSPSLDFISTASLLDHLGALQNGGVSGPTPTFLDEQLHSRDAQGMRLPPEFESLRTLLYSISLEPPHSSWSLSPEEASVLGICTVLKRNAKPPGPALSECRALPPLKVLLPAVAEKGKFC